MSRLNWMTYMKVLFDKLQSQQSKTNHSKSDNTDDSLFSLQGGVGKGNNGNSMHLRSSSQTQQVDAHQMLQALNKIKAHLPLQTKEEYSLQYGSERGFTVREVESSLKRLIIMRSAAGQDMDITWDDVIDLFIMAGTIGNGMV